MSALWHGKQRSRDRTRQVRVVIRYLLEKRLLTWGAQAAIAGRFGVSRQRVNQIVVQERRRMLFAGGSDGIPVKGEW